MPRKKKDDIVKVVLSKYEELRSKSQSRLAAYDRNREWFEGKVELMGAREDWQSSAIANVLEANIRTIVSVLTDSKPIMRCVAMPFKRITEDDLESLQVLRENLDNGLGHVWRVANMHKKLKKIVLDGSLTGCMCARVFWDKERYDGAGEIGIEPVHPRYIFFDPTVVELSVGDGSCDWFIYAMLKPLSWFRYYFPDKKVEAYEDNTKNREQKFQDKGLYIEAYKADYTIEEVKATDGKRVITETKRKYQNGRKIIVGTKTLLEDEEIDVFPFIVEPIADSSESLFGTDDVTRQIQLQIELNEKLSQISQNIALSASRQTVGDDACGVDMEEWGNEACKPGMHFQLQGGTEVEDFKKHFAVLDTPAFNHELFQYPYMIKEFMEVVSGVTKLMQGLAAKKERQTGFEVGKMLETATIRLRERAAHVEEFIRQVGLTILEYMKNYYTEERDLWHTDEVTGEPIVSTFRFPQEGSKITGKEAPVDFEFDVQVHPDSTLPIDLNSLANLAMQLKDMGVITNAELLKRVQYPDQAAALPDEMPQGPGGVPMTQAPPTGGM